jgi:hypothetical protein
LFFLLQNVGVAGAVLYIFAVGLPHGFLLAVAERP